MPVLQLLLRMYPSPSLSLIVSSSGLPLSTALSRLRTLWPLSEEAPRRFV